MTIKTAIQRLIRSLGWELRRLKNANIEEQAVKDILELARVQIVLDVGANTGQWGELIFDAGFSGTLVSFEAVPEFHRELVRHAQRRGESWKVAPCAALGSARGHIDFNISANKVSSSALPMLRDHEEAAPESRYVQKQRVPVERLDELAATLLSSEGDFFLKIDTQGYEMEVLKGASGLMHRAAAVQLELSLIPLYEGAPSFLEMITHMESSGYEIFNLVPVFKENRTGRLLQMDGFFIRSK